MKIMQDIRRPGRHSWALLWAMLAMGLAVTAEAQDRGDTGRIKPQPKVPVLRQLDGERPESPDGVSNWFAGASVGRSDGGRLFRVEEASDNAIPWGRGGKTLFTASRFSATLDPAAQFMVHGGYRFGRGNWSARGELSHARANLVAEVLQGQTGAVFLFDRFSTRSMTIVVERSLTAAPSHPYVSAGLSLSRLTATEEAALNQTSFGMLSALGYRQRFARGFQLDLEARLRRYGFEASEFRPTNSNDAYPTVDYTSESHLSFFDITVTVSFDL